LLIVSFEIFQGTFQILANLLGGRARVYDDTGLGNAWALGLVNPCPNGAVGVRDQELVAGVGRDQSNTPGTVLGRVLSFENGRHVVGIEPDVERFFPLRVVPGTVSKVETELHHGSVSLCY
jgi:hypothetical protein